MVLLQRHSFGLNLYRFTIEIFKLANRFSSWRKNTLSGNKRLAIFSKRLAVFFKRLAVFSKRLVVFSRTENILSGIKWLAVFSRNGKSFSPETANHFLPECQTKKLKMLQSLLHMITKWKKPAYIISIIEQNGRNSQFPHLFGLLGFNMIGAKQDFEAGAWPYMNLYYFLL